MWRALASASVLLTALSCSEASRPSILLVTIDTLRVDHTSAYGYRRSTTPHLAALAKEGARFEVAYAPSSTTGPSHASLLTGLQPIAHGVVKNGLPLPEEHPTVAEVLRENGWQTAGIVSSFVLTERFGYRRGFEYWDQQFDPATASVRLDDWLGYDVRHGFDRRADATTDAALRWLRETRRPEAPFLLFVHYFDPHAPYGAPGAARRRFAGGIAKETPRDRAIQLYDAEIAYTDEHLGRLVAGLEELGLKNHTIVVVTSDHGEGMMDHGYLMHGVQVYEEAVRVPLIVRWPGQIPAGQVLTAPVGLADTAATLLSLLGIPDRRIPGQDLSEGLRGRASLDPARPVFFLRHHYERGVVDSFRVAGKQYGVRSGRWKLIEAPDEQTLELFDLESDPDELESLAETRSDTVEELRREIATWRARHERHAEIPMLPQGDRRALEALGYVE